ncbi:MAG: RNA 2',3'-cyclic phosphodiesterase, partial [Bacillota bacterium]
VEEEAIPAISDGVGRAVADLDKFRMGVSSTGAFPHPSRARVLWAGVDEGRAAVEKVQEAVARALQRECGFQPDRRGFHSHVTVARVRRGEVLAAEEALADSCDTEWGHQWVGQVDLMKSDLRPGGPVHTVMDSLPLARLSSTC